MARNGAAAREIRVIANAGDDGITPSNWNDAMLIS
jgi:hypothetical protein